MRRSWPSRGRSYRDNRTRPACATAPEPFEYAGMKQAQAACRLPCRCAAQFLIHVPPCLIWQEVDIRLNASHVEVLPQSRTACCSIHARAHIVGGVGIPTVKEHMPSASRMADMTPESLIMRGGQGGTHGRCLVERLSRDRPHPEQRLPDDILGPEP